MIRLVALALLLAAAPAAAKTADATVKTLEFRFEPATFTAPPNGTLRVVNEGAEPHTLTSADPDHAFEALLAPGEAAEVALPNVTRTIHVYCRLHASAASTTGMVGDLTLAAAAADGAGRNTTGDGAGASGTPLPASLAAASWIAAALALPAVRRRRR